MSGVVTTEMVGSVLVTRVDDGKANALTHEIIGGVKEAAEHAKAEAKALVLIGRPGKFSAGFDLSVMTSSAEAARDLLGAGALMALDLLELPIPVLFGVTGHALAMGGILLTAADYRVGADGPFKLGLNEVAIGMPVPRFAVELCRDRLSPAWFTRSVQCAEILDPTAAMEAGYLDELAKPEDVESRVIEIAGQMAGLLHSGPFAQTRVSCRGVLAAKLRADLAEDLAAFG